MVKIKTALANNRALQIGFTSQTNADLDGTAGRFYHRPPGSWRLLRRSL